ncbi:MAG: hypothetical protein KAR39_04345 [Thermoplasmata archaeon]|nr:hypothetical protein [Thermoplasmata archaeon]
MNESGERGGDSPGADKGVQSPRGKHASPPSLSRIDDRDSEILSLARDRPITVLSISEKMDASLVECLHRARRLQRIGLLMKLDDSSPHGRLHLYVATQRRI